MIALLAGVAAPGGVCFADRRKSRASLERQPGAFPELAEGAAVPTIAAHMLPTQLRRYFEDRASTESAAAFAGAVEVTG
jgi:hypothetical protein